MLDDVIGMRQPPDEIPLAHLPSTVEVALAWLARECHGASLAKGWGVDADGNVPPMEVIVPRALCLMHSEISEALEEFRKPTLALDSIYFGAGAKPEGFPVELADLIHRVFDLSGRYNLPLAKALALKMQYNKTRPHRHGGKRC